MLDKILIIDDDAELCEMLSEYLRKEGFEVESVQHGARGLEKAREGNHQMVVLDVMLPGMNGFDLLRELRTTSDIPVLLLTARGDELDRIVGLEIGADDYLSKPFNARELLARIRAIGRRNAREQRGSSATTQPLLQNLCVFLDLHRTYFWSTDRHGGTANGRSDPICRTSGTHPCNFV